MKQHKISSGIGIGSRKLAMERLEARSMLAGNVTASVAGGMLTITGDSADNGVLIQQGHSTGEYAVTGYSHGGKGTSVNSGSSNNTILIRGVIGNIRIDLKGGNDALAVGNNTDALTQLANDSGFDLSLPSGGSVTPGISLTGPLRFFAPQNLTIATGGGDDEVVVIADVKGLANINLGNGDDNFAVGDAGVVGTATTGVAPALITRTALYGAGLTITSGQGSTMVNIMNATIKGLLNVQVGDGGNQVSGASFDAGSVRIVTGQGSDGVNLSDFNTDSAISVDTGEGNDGVFLNNFTAGQGSGPQGLKNGRGNVMVTTGDGDDNAVLDTFSADNVSLDTGGGNDGYFFGHPLAGIASAHMPVDGAPITLRQAMITKKLQLVTGSGDDKACLSGVTARDMSVDLGDGTNTGEIDDVHVAGDLTATGGQGNDHFYLGGGDSSSSTVGHSLRLDAGAGDDYAQIIDFLVSNDLQVLMGDGNDRASIGTSDGAEAVLGRTSVGHNFLLDAGAGNDIANVGNLDVHNDLKIILGGGNDTLMLTGMTIGRDASIEGNQGNDSATINTFKVARNLTVNMGFNDDSLRLSGVSVHAKTKLDGGSGKHDTLSDGGTKSVSGPLITGFETKT